jgi:uncharacterized protein (DUF1015 family)
MRSPRTPPADVSVDPGRGPLVLAPFRGLRYDPAVAGDLGTVVSPPYDVLDADTVRDLEAGNRRNVVRLILTRRFERPYVAVRERLESWREQGVLLPDRDPGLYLYQYTVDGITVRGLIGLVGLREESEGVVLPHEDVMPGPVEDRSVLMRTTQSNLEPILLVHQGTDRHRLLLADATAEAPVVDFTAADGSRHVLWTISDEDVLGQIADELAPATALIADGHHRYAAYLALQNALRDPDAPRGASPWDYGLAMLVDQDDLPLTVGPIHRSVAALTMSDVLDLAAQHGDEVRTCTDREAALTCLAGAPAADRTHFVLSDGRAWVVLTTARSHRVDAGVLHDRLLPRWQVSEEQVGYHHSLDQALHTVTRQPGVVVAVRPPTLEQVMADAARGQRMPRKSTSFSPKPRMGLVMRDLRDS